MQPRITNLQALLHTLKKRLLPRASFARLLERPELRLYAGDLPRHGAYQGLVGLSLTQADYRHIRHDITRPLPLPDNCVDTFQSEDVFEHIDPARLPLVLTEIYRVLKPGGTLRLSMPDYQCDLLYDRSLKGDAGEILFDPGGGGRFIDGRVVDGGHLWFPTYQRVRPLLEQSPFGTIRFLHYYDESGNGITHPIDYRVGHVMRTPDHDARVADPYRPMSIVVDCIK